MKRLLCLISNINAGGAETFLMKVYRQMDRTKYQMDFCINVSESCFYEDEVRELGGKIYRIPPKIQNRSEFKRQLTQLIHDNQYRYVLRITSNAMGFMDLKIAKNAGAKVCAVRSSNSSDGENWKLWLAHILGRIFYKQFVDVKIAPSDLAAKYTFGKKAYEAGNVVILHNAVDLDVFHYDAKGRHEIRQSLGLNDDILVVGHIGRFDKQKNHEYLLEVFQAITKSKPASVLLLVGKGVMEQQVRRKARELCIDDKVIFTGVRRDIPQVLSAMDVFVFPSLYEGMPNTVIEAQATGLPCIIADTITKEANITGLVQYLPLSASSEHWAEVTVNAVCIHRKDTRQDFLDNRYDIQNTTDAFVRLCFQDDPMEQKK